MTIESVKTKCTACTVCVGVCPKKCITLKENIEGFLYPVIDDSLCINCGLCEKTCPLNNKPLTNNIKTTGYVSYSKDEQNRISSSSGGLFSVIANEVIKNDGIVYGAAFDNAFKVSHLEVKTKQELEKLRGSKYVQSNLGDVFSNVKRNLEKGKEVLFSGTICQIAGLKSYLRKDYDNLLTIDVLCHGVPSPKVWDKYIRYIEKTNNKKIDDIQFRNKKNGWKNYSLMFEFIDKSRQYIKFSEDKYMKMFLRNICLRKSCYDCQFNEIDRVSDITLGDCWGIDKVIPDMDDDKGTSVMLIHTQNGKKYLNSIKKELEIREADIDLILPPGAGGRCSVKEHPKRREFFDKLDKDSMIELEKLVEPTVKEKIITFIYSFGGKTLRLLGLKKKR